MTQSLNDFLSDIERKKYATQQGSNMHMLLQNVVIDDMGNSRGNTDIISIIKQKSDLKPYFVPDAKTEVPIAGIINGVFISRRIDRLIIDNQTKTIAFLDYKTDTDKTTFYDKYKKQLNEYAQLLRSVYQGYKISGFILWIHDWELEKMVSL